MKEEREKLDNSEPYGRQVTTSGRQVESKETSGKHGCNSVARFPEPSWNLGSLQSGGKVGIPVASRDETEQFFGVLVCKGSSVSQCLQFRPKRISKRSGVAW